MNPKNLIRDAKKVHACLQELPDSRLIALKPCKIYVPARFEDQGLYEQVGADTYIVGIYAIVVEDKYYGISLVNAMIRIEPSSVLKVKINNEDYFEFTFAEGSTVFSSVNLVKNDVLVYKIYNEFISKGKIPWYLNYIDTGKLFDSAYYHAGANIGQDPEVTELIVSIITRDASDKVKYYRTTINKTEEDVDKTPSFIPLESVTYGATNTTNKLAGSYWQEGLTSALVSPSTRVERIESILRR
jgi:hypothetical protein